MSSTLRMSRREGRVEISFHREAWGTNSQRTTLTIRTTAQQVLDGVDARCKVAFLARALHTWRPGCPGTLSPAAAQTWVGEVGRRPSTRGVRHSRGRQTTPTPFLHPPQPVFTSGGSPISGQQPTLPPWPESSLPLLPVVPPSPSPTLPAFSAGGGVVLHSTNSSLPAPRATCTKSR